MLGFGTIGAFAQEDLVEISGVIRSSDTQEPVPYVHVMNPSSGYGTVSNTEGRFWITMKQSDTLVFSAISYADMAFSLKPDQSSRRLNVEIEMNEETMELQPVKIFAYRDEEALKQALIELDIPLEEETNRMQLPGFHYGPRREHKPTVGSPISFIASKFSKEMKEQKKLIKSQSEYDYRKIIQAKYNEKVVLALTGLPEDEIDAFMDFCVIEEAFIERANEYDIALAVNKCLKDYALEK